MGKKKMEETATQDKNHKILFDNILYIYFLSKCVLPSLSHLLYQTLKRV